MDETMTRLSLELPFRERVRRQHRCPPSLEHPRLTEAQAALIEEVIVEVLDALELSAAAATMGSRSPPQPSIGRPASTPTMTPS